jgi:ATP-dependent helicase HrpB
MLALQPSPRRKIILATNIAETSLTIDGVRWVVDSGLVKIPMFDPRRGLDRLELKRISKASAVQRAGRAGRTAPGRCLRLWSAKEHATLAEFESPEIKRVDLCGAVLDLHMWGASDAAKFGWFEAPESSALHSAGGILEMLGAVRESRLTELGKRLSRLPLHPRIARLMDAAADAGCGDEGAAVAALLSEKDIRRSVASGPRHQRTAVTRGDSDILLRMDDLSEAERFHFAAHLRERGIDPLAARQVVQTRNELQRLARRQLSASRKEPSRETLLKLLLLAYPDRVCRRRGSDRSAAIMTGGSGIRLDPESVVTDHEFFLALDARDDPHSAHREANVRIASAIEPDWLMELFPDSISRELLSTFDENRRRVVGKTIVRYRDLILSEEIGAAIDPASAGHALADALRPRAREIFSGDARAMNLLRRVALLRKIMPEHPWPMFDAAELSEIMGDLCAGKSSHEQVMREPLADALMGRLQYPLDQLLRQHAPEVLEVPSSSRIELQYRDDQPPVLAVRLQEVFGWRDTPRIAGGRVAVLLHLLGPNFRPVQITSDLKSFWATAYFQVRKDLRVRYPKHSWPDDPLTAAPVAKGRARKR